MHAVMLGIGLIPAVIVIFFVGFVFNFETPHYYVERGKRHVAEKVNIFLVSVLCHCDLSVVCQLLRALHKKGIKQFCCLLHSSNSFDSVFK